MSAAVRPGDVPAGFYPADVATPDGISMWVRDESLTSTFFGEAVDVSAVIEGEGTWEGVDVDALAALPDQLDDLLQAALEFVHAELRRDPSVVGLDAAAARAYTDATAVELPLDLPAVVFHADGTWVLHFAEGGFPGCDPYGLAVVCAGSQPLRVEDLSDADEID